MAEHDEMSIEVSIALLKRDMVETKESMKNLTTIQSIQTEMLHKLDVNITKVLDRPVCANPGACIEIAELRKEDDRRIKSLEDSRLESKASLKTVMFVASLLATVSALIGGAVSWVVQTMQKVGKS
jgi:hypothetical protein